MNMFRNIFVVALSYTMYQKILFAVPTEIDSLGDTFTSVDFTRILFVQLVSQWRNEIVKQIARKTGKCNGALYRTY